jgi:hypothetical protein
MVYGAPTLTGVPFKIWSWNNHDEALLLLGIPAPMRCEFKSSCEAPTLDVEELKAPIYSREDSNFQRQLCCSNYQSFKVRLCQYWGWALNNPNWFCWLSHVIILPIINPMVNITPSHEHILLFTTTLVRNT